MRPVPASTSSPSGSEESRGVGLRLVAIVMCTLLGASVVLLVAPDALRLLGIENPLLPLARNPAIWLATVGVLVLLLNFFAQFTGSRPRVSAEVRDGQAAELGGEVVEGRVLGPGGEWVEGSELRLPVGEHTLTVATVVSGSGKHRVRNTRAVVALEVADLFGFQALSAGHPARWLGGIIRPLLAQGMRDALGRGKSDEQRRSIESVAYLSGPPLRELPGDLADLLELRSNDPARAIRLFASPGVAAAIRALGGLTKKWEWTLYPSAQPGRAELTVTLPGGCSDTEILRVVRDLQRAALERFETARAA